MKNRNNYDLSNFRNYKNILKFFVPSEPYKKICIDSGLFSEDQIIVTGTISSDFWFDKIQNDVFNTIEN